MKSKKFRTMMCILAAAAALTAAAAMASGGAGSQSDPLVTLSYLTETFTSQVMEKVDAEIAKRNAQLNGASGGYTVVTLSPGQALTGEAGCEVLLRSGEANCAASPPPGLADATDGSTINGGARLAVNHLYFMTDSRTVASAAGAVLLVRGTYTVS